MLDGLAFMPVADLQDMLAYLRQHIPEDVAELQQLLAYFDATYVSGVLRCVPNTDSHRLLLRTCRTPPLFPPTVWNVHEATLANRERTNNVCEGWNHAFANIVGHRHPSLWVLLGALQQDQTLVATALLQEVRGQPPAKRIKRSVHHQQQRLQKLCRDRRDGLKSVKALRALGHRPLRAAAVKTLTFMEL